MLVVDDENNFADILVQRLNLRGFIAHAVYGGQEAISFVEKNRPDALLLDVKMPLMSGIEVLKHVKQDHPKTAVIMLIGYSSVNEEQEAMRHGAFIVLRKPPDIDVIVETLKRALKHLQR
ncbi:MAG: response regulator [Nitrospirae bacterium]|nr:response regulator [Nitrospirota bacterium]